MKNMGLDRNQNLIFLLILSLMIVLFSSCDSIPDNIEDRKEAQIYSVKKELLKREHEVSSVLTVFLNDGQNLMATEVKSDDDDLRSILNTLKNGIEEKELYRTIPDGNIIERVERESKTVKIYLGDDYPSVPKVASILIRSSLVKSYTSLDYIDFVEFYYDNLPLKDSNNMPYGAYSFDDIVYDNTLIQEIVYQDKVKFYYPRDGALEGVVEEVDISMNDCIEDIVINRLKTISEKNPFPAVPDGTKFINADIVDGVCYLNLNESFLHNNASSVEDTLAVYSIVNTITELPDIAKVQFLINGEKMDIIRAGKDFNETFEYNHDLVKDN